MSDASDRLRVHLDEAVRIQRLRDSLIDLDIVVDDARHELVAAIVRLRTAIRDRDAALRALLAGLDATEAA
jgi:hypothetical protein